mmetsp:Transcript_168280/g.540644  ORF Transcript_168280/g.540644 Transcript_168280/m.540644 type:complete len:254 (+) Transcript_168280:375-1136(+)
MAAGSPDLGVAPQLRQMKRSASLHVVDEWQYVLSEPHGTDGGRGPASLGAGVSEPVPEFRQRVLVSVPGNPPGQAVHVREVPFALSSFLAVPLEKLPVRVVPPIVSNTPFWPTVEQVTWTALREHVDEARGGDRALLEAGPGVAHCLQVAAPLPERLECTLPMPGPRLLGRETEHAVAGGAAHIEQAAGEVLVALVGGLLNALAPAAAGQPAPALDAGYGRQRELATGDLALEVLLQAGAATAAAALRAADVR